MITKYELFETKNKKYYHGSYDKLPIGTILKPHNKSYTRINDTQLENIMEKYRPKDKLSRYDSVFMTTEIDMITPDHNYELEKKYAENYWNSIPYNNLDYSVFEYRTPAAKIIKLIEEN